MKRLVGFMANKKGRETSLPSRPLDRVVGWGDSPDDSSLMEGISLSGKTCPRCGTTIERASNSTSIPGMYKWACPKCGYVIHMDK
jgi:predicted RNA-binding Zn-ribbon protein involved in translation (DUF1610 family)